MSLLLKRISALCLGLLTALLLSCSGDAKGEIETGTDFSMAVATTQYTVAPGAAVFTPVEVTWVGCPPRDVLFEVQGLPAGVVPIFTANPHPTATRLQLNLNQAIPPGSYDLLLKGSSGSLVHTKALHLTVSASAPGFSVTIAPPVLAMDSAHPGIATIQITRTGGFSEPVSVKTILPPGFSSTVTALARPLGTSAAAADELRTLTIQGGNAAPGTYNISVELTAGGQFIQKDLGATVYALPVISGFTASPAQIRTGFTAALLPLFTDGSGVITPTGGPATSGQPVVVAPVVTTAYTLTVTNPAGSLVTRSASVVVQDVNVSLSPSARYVTVGKSVSVAATVTGATDPALIWTLLEATGGTLVATGASATYTAPATPGTYHVRATSVEDPSQFGEFTATVVPAPVITSFTASASPIDRGASSTLTGVFTGGTGNVDKGVGNMASGVGVSATPLVTTTYTLTVTNLAGDFVTKTAVVTVNGVSVTVNPASVTLILGSSQLFSATVTGAVDTAVTWSVTEAGGGTISAGGLYTPPAVDGLYHVVATSHSDPSKFGTAEITVSPVTIAISPSTFSSFTVGQTQQFTAIVKGALDTSVTWAVTEPGGGTITPGGLYTAPGIFGTYHLTATSHADPTKIATVTIKVGKVKVVLTQPQPRKVTAGERFYFGVGLTEADIYRIDGASNAAGLFSSDEPGATWGIEVILGRRDPKAAPAPARAGHPGRPFGDTFYYQAGPIPGLYHFRIASQEDPSAYAEYIFEVLQNPIIYSFTLTQVGGAWSLTADFLNDTSPGSTAVFTDETGAYVGDAVSGLPFSVGLTPREAYTLTVTNSLFASTNYGPAKATAIASNIVVTINEGATWSMAGKSATTNPNQLFTANAAGSTAGVNWSVTGGPDPGGIDYLTGLYTPSTLPGTFTVTANSVSDPSKTDSIAVTVIPLFLWPGNQVIGLSHRLVLKASALGEGSSNPAFLWEMDPSQISGVWGSVDANGVYSSPTPFVGVPPSNPIVWVKLASNPSIKAFVEVVVSTAINGGGKLRGTFGTPGLGAGVVDARSAHTLTTLANGEVLLAGGDQPLFPAALLKNAYYYRTADNTFYNSAFSQMSFVRKWATATLLLDGSVLIAGGFDENGVPLGSAERFIPYSSFGGYFVPVTGMLVKKRAGHTATLLANGKVLLVGGQETPGPGAVFTKSAELYDPVSDTFAPVAGLMRSPRIHHRAVRLLNGRVLVLGGSKDGLFADTSLTNEVEIYDPATNTFSPGANLSFPTMDPTVDLTPNGDVIMAGGWFVPSPSATAASSEVFKYITGSNLWTPTLTYPSMSFTRQGPMGMMLPDLTYAIWGGSGNTNMDFFDPFSGLFDASIGLGVNPVNYEGQTGRLVFMLNGKLLAAGWDGGSSAFKAVTFP